MWDTHVCTPVCRPCIKRAHACVTHTGSVEDPSFLSSCFLFVSVKIYPDRFLLEPTGRALLRCLFICSTFWAIDLEISARDVLSLSCLVLLFSFLSDSN